MLSKLIYLYIFLNKNSEKLLKKPVGVLLLLVHAVPLKHQSHYVLK
jgi:hypothetical protein